MENPIRKAIEASGKPAYKIADELGMSRGTVYLATKKDGIPTRLRIDTLNRILNKIGYQVKITLEKLQ